MSSLLGCCRHVLDCTKCGFQMSTVKDRVVQALLPERAEHYANFIEDYEGHSRS